MRDGDNRNARAAPERGHQQTMEQARADFAAAWAVSQPTRTEADFVDWRCQRAWTAWKICEWDARAGCRRLPDGRARCFCGAKIDVDCEKSTSGNGKEGRQLSRPQWRAKCGPDIGGYSRRCGVSTTTNVPRLSGPDKVPAAASVVAVDDYTDATTRRIWPTVRRLLPNHRRSVWPVEIGTLSTRTA